MLFEPAPQSRPRRRRADGLNVCNSRADCAMLCGRFCDGGRLRPLRPLQRGPVAGVGPGGRPSAGGGLGFIECPVGVQIEGCPLLAMLAPGGSAFFWMQMDDLCGEYVWNACCEGGQEQGRAVVQDDGPVGVP